MVANDRHSRSVPDRWILSYYHHLNEVTSPTDCRAHEHLEAMLVVSATPFFYHQHLKLNRK